MRPGGLAEWQSGGRSAAKWRPGCQLDGCGSNSNAHKPQAAMMSAGQSQHGMQRSCCRQHAQIATRNPFCNPGCEVAAAAGVFSLWSFMHSTVSAALSPRKISTKLHQLGSCLKTLQTTMHRTLSLKLSGLAQTLGQALGQLVLQGVTYCTLGLQLFPQRDNLASALLTCDRAHDVLTWSEGSVQQELEKSTMFGSRSSSLTQEGNTKASGASSWRSTCCQRQMLCYKRRESLQCSESSPAPPCGLTPHALLQNIDTDQIIPAEYLTLVPSKVWGSACGASQLLTRVWGSVCAAPPLLTANARQQLMVPEAFKLLCRGMSMRSWAAMPS